MFNIFRVTLALAMLAFLGMSVLPKTAGADGDQQAVIVPTPTIHSIRVDWNETTIRTIANIGNNSPFWVMARNTNNFLYGEASTRTHSRSFPATMAFSRFEYASTRLDMPKFVQVNWDLDCGSVGLALGLQPGNWTQVDLDSNNKPLVLAFKKGLGVEVVPGTAQGLRGQSVSGNFVIFDADQTKVCGEAIYNWYFAAPPRYLPFLHFGR